MNDHAFEQAYWGDCTNTFDEDQKHYVYAHYMGITRLHWSFQVENKRIIDIGGGPTSMLLKCQDLQEGLVVDPIAYPEWTRQRYAVKNIRVIQAPGESITETGWDEAWIYNCMQHAEDPEEIIRRASIAAPVIRMFEWIDVAPHPGHPHELTQQLLDKWLRGKGGTVQLNQQGCHGRAYYGVFAR